MFRIVSNNIIFFSNYKNINKLEKLIIFHGLGGEAIDFLFLKNLNLKKIQVLVAILPGHSNTYLRLSGDPLLEFSKKIHLFLKKKNIKNFSFYVHSMGNIVSILLIRFFLKKKCKLLINNEGNITSSDAGFVTSKTITYPEEEFINIGFDKLKKKCSESYDSNIKKWALSLNKIKPSYFYRYCEYTVFWSKTEKILRWINFYFKKKIYVYGEKSKNQKVLDLIFGHKKKCLVNVGHFAHFEKSVYIKQLIFKELNVKGT